MIKNFIFNDIVLYDKCWFEHSENIVDDLSYLFQKIYAWKPKDEKEVARFMLRAIDTLYGEMNLKFDKEHSGRFNNSLVSFVEEIDKRVWLYDCSRDMAIIYWALGIFSNLSINEIKLTKPHYGKKEHFRLGSMFGKRNISMTYKEMNRIADKHFKD